MPPAAAATPPPGSSADEAARRPFITDRSFFGQPGGLATLFATEMWERFSYYGIRPLLVLFMTAALTSGGFGFERPQASAIVGIYAASVYLASLPGGWVADRWLGLQRSIWYGGLFISAGHVCIALSAIFAQSTFFLGLVFIVVGTGLLKPNVSALVGDLYPEGGARRDAGFSIFYMGINTGAFLAPLFTGYLGERVGWHWGFGVAGVGMLIGVLTYRARVAPTLGPLGLLPSSGPEEQHKVKRWALSGLAVAFIVVLLAMSGLIHVDPIFIAERLSVTMATMGLLYFGYLFLFAGLTGDEKKRMAVIFALCLFSIVFWAAFEQAPTSLNLFARDFTDRTIFGWEMPTLWLQSANSFFVITLAPVFGAIWIWLAKRDLEVSAPAKFAFALAITGVAFLMMVWASKRVITGGGLLKVSALWLIGSYLLQTIGELSLSPVGLSSMTKLAPRKFVGQMMGLWFLATAMGNLIAGLVGGRVDPEKLDQMPQLFMRTAMSLFIAAAILTVLIIPIRKMLATTKD
ncbi:MAG: peptide MFS transporter [Gemmatimonadota bacterium]